jgi:hypothetical protein
VVPGVPAQFQLLTSNPLEFDRSQTTTYWYTNDINEYMRGILSSSLGNLNRINSIRANVNLDDSCNAFYRGAEKSINFFASSPSCNNTAFSTIIYHEWGHGLDDIFGGISRVDGLSEGWADIVAIYRSGQPIIGDGFRKNGSSVRSALNSTRYPASACDPDSVHCLGQVWMGFAWQVRQGLRSALGTGPGTLRAERIVLGSIVANATNAPAAVREVFILDDDDGNLLNGTPNYSSLSAAALSRNLPFPRKQVVTLSHAELGDTDQQFTPRLVTVSATPLFGSVEEMRVIVTPSTTEKALTRTMVPTGIPDEYMALLPGYGSPVTVSYFIESEHSGGSVARMPGTGAFVYRVGKKRVFLFDDFESGDLGWTHGPVGNDDDWQLGTPVGLSGSSSGISWSDPFTAYSGLNIWGNDLGPPGFNGAYGIGVDNWLRSPNFSTLGQTGLSLRFARWLTVEEHQYDQATILVNDQEVWSNSEGNHLLDTGWSLQEIPIPEADDQDSVHIEWRLKTDSSVQFGGWNIDDVQVVSHVAIPSPDIIYRLTPEQTPIGGPMTAFVYGPPGSPALILFSDNPGPTILPGIPTLSVGADASMVPAVLDAGGAYFTAFAAPSDPALIGELVYSQVLALDGATLVASNPTIVLFTK